MKLGRPIGKGPLWWLRVPHFTVLANSVSESHMGLAPYFVVGSRAFRVGRSWNTLRPQVVSRRVDGRTVYEKNGRGRLSLDGRYVRTVPFQRSEAESNRMS